MQIGEKEEKELIREKEKNTDSEIGTFRDREAVKKETLREVGKGQVSPSYEGKSFRIGGS